MTQTKTAGDAIFDAADEAALKYRAVKTLRDIDRTLFSIAVSLAAITFILSGIGIEMRLARRAAN